ncbi:MAG: VOC family protein [Pigmentiphaga sp.]
MDKPRNNEASRIYPTFRYHDSVRMVDWLVQAFGFRVVRKYMDGDTIAHSELAFGNALIMVGHVREDHFGSMVGKPGENGGKATYLAVDDADAALERARQAGAEILEGPTDRDYGSREFICRDPEGNVWVLGTYWPTSAV